MGPSGSSRSKALALGVIAQDLGVIAQAARLPTRDSPIEVSTIPDPPELIREDLGSSAQTKSRRVPTPEEESRHQNVQLQVDTLRKLGAPKKRKHRPAPSSAPHYRRKKSKVLKK